MACYRFGWTFQGLSAASRGQPKSTRLCPQLSASQIQSPGISLRRKRQPCLRAQKVRNTFRTCPRGAWQSSQGLRHRNNALARQESEGTGPCLLGVDETQFMTQSDNASALVTRTMLAIADVQIPWFMIANYSLCWKLLNRPAESTQRLLGRPTILLPDPPGSEDWMALLLEYQVIAGGVFEFKLADNPVGLWNLSAGLKRELVKLLVNAYRMARRRGATKVIWQDVLDAFASVEFSVPRRDINLLIAHAAQGGDLRKDLECPFSGTEIDCRKEAYADQLRQARNEKLAEKVVTAAMTGSEKQSIAGIKELATETQNEAPGQVVPIRRSAKRTLEGLLDAGRRAREKRGTHPAAV